MACEIAQQIVDMVQGQPLVGVINAPALTNATSDACKPWIELAQSLGYLANSISQPSGTPTPSISIDLYGKSKEKPSLIKRLELIIWNCIITIFKVKD